jgi:hypothetical protein
MTTTVVITVPKPNHKAVQVTVERATGIDGEMAVSHQHVLSEGMSTIVHLHGGNRVSMSEVEKPTTPGPVANTLG